MARAKIALLFCVLSIVGTVSSDDPRKDIPNPNTNTNTNTNTNPNTKPYIQQEQKKDASCIFAGLIKDSHQMVPDTLGLIVNMSCSYSVPVHIVLGKGANALKDAYNKTVEKSFSGVDCASFTVDLEPQTLGENETSNRVDRITKLRDFQKRRIQRHIDIKDLNSTVVILADLDISSFPPIPDILRHSEKISSSSSSSSVDVLCANGKMWHVNRKYYDTFATILLPDTFVHPLNLRKNPRVAREEDPNFIIGENFRYEHLFKWFENQGKEGSGAEMRPVSVRSCFGGLSLFRASKFFEKRCTYSAKLSPDQYGQTEKYRDKEAERICEHVKWNNCMRMVDKNFSIAVQPDMVTTWNTKVDKKNENEWDKFLQKEKDKGKVVVERESINDIDQASYSETAEEEDNETAEEAGDAETEWEMFPESEKDESRVLTEKESVERKTENGSSKDEKLSRTNMKEESSSRIKGSLNLKQVKGYEMGSVNGIDQMSFSHSEPAEDPEEEILVEMRLAFAIHLVAATILIGAIIRIPRSLKCCKSWEGGAKRALLFNHVSNLHKKGRTV